MSTDGPTIPTIQTDRGEWLRWDLARSLADDVAGIREELADLQLRFKEVMGDVRLLPGGQALHTRVDAYPGVRLDRDMGLGQDADAWLAEVADFLEPLGVATLAEGCDGFVGGNAWGPCAECGRRLEDHRAVGMDATEDRPHAYECWAPRPDGVCREACSCWCHALPAEA